MVRVWKDEVSAVAEFVNKVLARLGGDVHASIESDEGFERDTFYLVLSRDNGASARALMTWEAWINAQTDPSDLELQLQKISDELDMRKASRYSYAITTAGLITKPSRTARMDLADEAAVRETETIKLPRTR